MNHVMSLKIFAILAAFCISGCVSTMAINPETAENQAVHYERGNEIVVSQGEVSVVVISRRPTFQTDAKRLGFDLVIENLGAETLLVSDENVRAFDQLGEELLVPSRDQVLAEIRRAAAWAAFGAALEGVSESIQASQAGYSHSYGTFSTYGSGGGSFGTVTSTTYNAAAAEQARQAANQRSQERMSSIIADRDSSVASVADVYIARHSIFPGDGYASRFTVDVPRLRDGNALIRLQIEVEQDTHLFTYRITSIE